MIKFLLGLFLALNIYSASAEYYVNEDMDLNVITATQAYEIFTFQTKFLNYERITIVLPPYNTRSFRALANNLGKTSISYLDTISSKTHGGAIQPVWADTELGVLRKVSIINNSIGYYDDKIAINTGTHVRIIGIK